MASNERKNIVLQKSHWLRLLWAESIATQSICVYFSLSPYYLNNCCMVILLCCAALSCLFVSHQCDIISDEFIFHCVGKLTYDVRACVKCQLCVSHHQCVTLKIADSELAPSHKVPSLQSNSDWSETLPRRTSKVGYVDLQILTSVQSYFLLI